MKTKLRSYLMALAAGVVIIGGATAGTRYAQSSHDAALVADTVMQTTSASSAPPVGPAPSVGQASAPEPGTPAPTSTAPTADPATSPTQGPTTPTPAVAQSQYKDGSYSATATYTSPGGPQKLGVTLVLASDVVTDTHLDLLGDAGLAHTFQAAFQSGYAAQVVGKEITSIKLGVVAGSSLTGNGFNDALQQIEAQAHA